VTIPKAGRSARKNNKNRSTLFRDYHTNN